LTKTAGYEIRQTDSRFAGMIASLLPEFFLTFH
jgi:hypothetical protein